MPFSKRCRHSCLPDLSVSHLSGKGPDCVQTILGTVPCQPFHQLNRPSKKITTRTTNREWLRYCRKVYWTKMAQHGPNDHFGRNDLIPNWILAFARPFWSANRILAIPELGRTPRGGCSTRGRSRHLLESPPSQNPF